MAILSFPHAIAAMPLFLHCLQIHCVIIPPSHPLQMHRPNRKCRLARSPLLNMLPLCFACRPLSLALLCLARLPRLLARSSLPSFAAPPTDSPCFVFHPGHPVPKLLNDSAAAFSLFGHSFGLPFTNSFGVLQTRQLSWPELLPTYSCLSLL